MWYMRITHQNEDNNVEMRSNNETNDRSSDCCQVVHAEPLVAGST